MCSPNPFKDHATMDISWDPLSAGSKDATILVTIHDAAGRLVRSFGIPKQVETFKWDGRDEAGHELPSGVYFLRLAPGQDASPVKVTLIR
jgi:flagellar hook assembly protein FlgD